jgi:hypothetical protein
MSIRTVVAKRFADFKRVQDLTESRTVAYYTFCCMACIGLLATIAEVEVLFGSAAAPTDSCCRINSAEHSIATTVLKWVVSASTALAVPLLYRYYMLELQLGKARKFYASYETLLSTELAGQLLFELLILVVHPLPHVDSSFELSVGHLGATLTYHWDAFLSLAVVSRTYLIFRAIHFHIGFDTQMGTKLEAAMNNVSLGPAYTFRYVMKRWPFRCVGLISAYMVVVLAYALRIAESPISDDLSYYVNTLWVVVITATTVGYGDFFPQSNAGRVVAIIAVTLGTCVIALLVTGVIEVSTRPAT